VTAVVVWMLFDSYGKINFYLMCYVHFSLVDLVRLDMRFCSALRGCCCRRFSLSGPPWPHFLRASFLTGQFPFSRTGFFREHFPMWAGVVIFHSLSWSGRCSLLLFSPLPMRIHSCSSSFFWCALRFLRSSLPHAWPIFFSCHAQVRPRAF
jgi:hypothetical protein